MRVRAALRDRLLSIAACGCLGGFIASTVGCYLGAFAGMDAAGALVAAALGAWIDAR